MKQAVLCALMLAGIALAITPAGADTGQPQQPIKKAGNGICYPPDNSNYSRVTEFVPFKTMVDCVKSGGKPAPQHAK